VSLLAERPLCSLACVRGRAAHRASGWCPRPGHGFGALLRALGQWYGSCLRSLCLQTISFGLVFSGWNWAWQPADESLIMRRVSNHPWLAGRLAQPQHLCSTSVSFLHIHVLGVSQQQHPKTMRRLLENVTSFCNDVITWWPPAMNRARRRS
jgi:hypothetical protein